MYYLNVFLKFSEKDISISTSVKKLIQNLKNIFYGKVTIISNKVSRHSNQQVKMNIFFEEYVMRGLKQLKLA